ncbi:MAG: fused response regulator/phosphatase [Candidatus Pacebacteria bacterium]|nr:fused response regulator/phosphatase [Candidatus Paceibacterota bacterium]
MEKLIALPSSDSPLSLPAAWPILLVDDDHETLMVTQIALSDYQFRGRELELINAHSAESARRILAARRDIAIVILDVVMETQNAGLTLVEAIRGELQNHQIRIILRTGESHFDLRELIHRYDINDFHHKTDITVERLEIIITAALRAWSEIELAAKAAALHESARLAEAEMQILAKVQERLDDDLSRARQMQLGIMPREEECKALGLSHGISCQAYFEPAHELAGDYWSLRAIDDESLVVILVDFSGHGVTAALNSFLFHSLWLRCPVTVDDPAASLNHLNRDLHEILPSGILATGMIVTINRTQNRIWWSASGWPSAALLRGEQISWLCGDGPLLGPMASPEFVTHSQEFLPADSLILYSDALIETQDSLQSDSPEQQFRQRFSDSLRQARLESRSQRLSCLINASLKNEIRPLRDDLTVVWLQAE